MSGEEQSLADRILSYRKEAIESPDKTKGIRILLPDIDRHYYINLRTRLDPASDTGVKRDMWMYFPSSHRNGNGSSWPDLSKLNRSDLPDLKGYSFQDDPELKDFNHDNETSQKYGFPFDKSGVIFQVISDHNEYFFSADSFIKFHKGEEGEEGEKDVNKILESLFSPARYPLSPDEYVPFLWSVEKELIYDEFPSDKVWIYYPLSFRGIFVSALIARIPEQKLQVVAETLPLIGNVVCEKLLLRYTQFDKTSPLLGVRNDTAALTLVSTLAAQCQLTNVKREGRTIRFSSGECCDKEDCKRSYDIKISAGVNRVEFMLHSNSDEEKTWEDRIKYFDTLWNSVSPMLHRYTELSQRRRLFGQTAIMSRNLSHNIGSHALANSAFFREVGVLDLISSAETAKSGKQTIENEKIWRARTRLGGFNNYLQGRLDFIARSMGEISSQSEPMFFVNDLVRGFLGQTVLLNTLLSDNGYTSAGMRFTVTIKQCNKEATSVLFKPNNTQGDKEERHIEFEPADPGNEDEPAQVEDVLVGVPGGMIGRHAFFAFMENYMRNAAKYGARAKANTGGCENFDIHLRLESCSRDQGVLGSQDTPVDCYVLTISDNISVGGKDIANKHIREHLDKELIDESGDTRTEGHGIQEMKICAEFLAGGGEKALTFPPDPALAPPGTEQADTFCHPLGQDYISYIEGVSIKKIEHRHSMACFSQGEGKNCQGEDENDHGKNKKLTYALLLQQPCLLGIVDWDANWTRDGETATVINEPTAAFYKDIDTLAQRPAYFGLIRLTDADVDITALLAKVGELHTALPFRLMVVVKAEDEAERLRGSIINYQKKAADLWWTKRNGGKITQAFPFPQRRLHVIDCEKLFELGMDSSSDEWQQCMVEVYDRWLYAWKRDELRGDETQWHLGIGFERKMDSILKQWNVNQSGSKPELGFGVDGYDIQHLRLHLFVGGTSKKDDSAIMAEHIDDKGNRDKKKLFQIDGGDGVVTSVKEAALALDNHGNVIEGGESSGIAAYHPFSGSGQIALYQMLESLPSDRFVRTFLLFSVAEALLTRVVVVDERVAESTIVKDGEKLWVYLTKRAREFHSAGIIPVYRIHSQKKTDKNIIEYYPDYLSTNIEEGIKNEAETCKWRENDTKEEGLHLTPYEFNQGEDTGKGTFIRYCSGSHCKQLTCVDINSADKPADFIVIHEGVTDSLHDNGAWHKFLTHEELYSLCPAVVRTSGRGSTSRYLGGRLPFLEFTELSDATYRQMNKVALAKGLLTLRGTARGEIK